jgi:hypothetical protein
MVKTMEVLTAHAQCTAPQTDRSMLVVDDLKKVATPQDGLNAMSSKS